MGEHSGGPPEGRFEVDTCRYNTERGSTRYSCATWGEMCTSHRTFGKSTYIQRYRSYSFTVGSVPGICRVQCFGYTYN